ncbi:DUF5819 family protein [uncultured Microbacterium sp.]|uniref:DUF5819 family protein n=1 Tax=uncultured Microbacterium sp. TaxID=191216 RepID=UPI00262480A0|nr:DUF5819 family protein [uncultured Microbacterium sp.]
MGLFVIWHIFATFLWVAPASPLREVVPKSALRGYMSPLFGQSWSVFAPSPINGDYYLDIRAQVKNGDGDESVTDWVRATDVETSWIRHNLTPPRSAGLAVDVTRGLYTEYKDLDESSQELVGLNWHKDAWNERLAERLTAESSNAPDKYLEAEERVAAYATQVAYAVWGDDVDKVQFRVSRQAVIPFSQRNNPEATRPEPVSQDYGWRGLIEYDGQSRDQFRDYFCSAPIGVC